MLGYLREKVGLCSRDLFDLSRGSASEKIISLRELGRR